LHPELSVKTIPRFGALQILRPQLANRDGVRITGISRAPGGVVFRGEGAIQSGIWREKDGQKSQLLLEDGDSMWMDPQMVGSQKTVLLVQGLSPSGAPSHFQAAAFIAEGRSPLVLGGQSVGVSHDGRVAVVIDVLKKTLTRVDVDAGTAEKIGTLAGGMDPQLAPLIAVDALGEEALFMDSRKERGDASLMGVDLKTGALSELIPPLPEPSRIGAAFGGGQAGVIAMESRLGSSPQSRLVHLTENGAREIFKVGVAQPAALPLFIDEDTVVALWSLKPHPLSTYGPVDVVLFSLSGKTQTALTQKGDLTGRLCYDDGKLFVEGGSEFLRMDLQA
jgi:hypothetical protein